MTRPLFRSVSLSRTMITSTSKGKDMSALRSSASLVVINSSNEVLLVHRNPTASSFAGMHVRLGSPETLRSKLLADSILVTTQVFPGGIYEEKQDESYQMAAIRETFEETGLLLASSTSKPFPSDAILDASRESIHTGRTLFGDFLKQNALSVDPKALLPFTEWISPVGIPRCAHTYIFVPFVLGVVSPANHTHTTAAVSTRASTSLSCLPSPYPAVPFPQA